MIKQENLKIHGRSTIHEFSMKQNVAPWQKVAGLQVLKLPVKQTATGDLN